MLIFTLQPASEDHKSVRGLSKKQLNIFAKGGGSEEVPSSPRKQGRGERVGRRDEGKNGQGGSEMDGGKNRGGGGGWVDEREGEWKGWRKGGRGEGWMG